MLNNNGDIKVQRMYKKQCLITRNCKFHAHSKSCYIVHTSSRYRIQKFVNRCRMISMVTRVNNINMSLITNNDILLSSGHHSNKVKNIEGQITVVGLPIHLISLERGRLNLFCQFMLKCKTCAADDQKGTFVSHIARMPQQEKDKP